MASIKRSNFFLYVSWVTAMIATFGSLYFSEVRGFEPCDMCWYQRILMYPLALILGVAAYHSDVKIKKYALPLSIIGVGTSLYHYSLQKFPSLATASPCSEGVPCNMQYINWFGFVTIPFLALVAFSFISVFLMLARKGE
ncbi:disulfide oxidoreductase [Alkalicoccobacillus murimartini]|uniref:Probable disulfide formation protein n=1 Tax=Alkalicoccobacillus murimartini TaxID=171685 RepID=A0ABT9YK42_9BACI|nr:disulfide oxidoreductase [Alkalicoccobacillus murimartini]MDQ0207582.1 disulfide bond formation protein DsbB [Alkalicoccobacillus murimartini]